MTVSNDLGGGAVDSGGSGAGMYGEALAAGVGELTSFYQPFISQNWASNAGNQAFDLQRWWAVNAASLAMKGLAKAGVNPILAITKGMPGGASTPVPYGTFDGQGDVIGRAVSSAKAAGSMRDQLSILRNQSEMAEYQKLQEFHGVYTAQAEAVAAEANAKIAEANRDIVNETKDAAIVSAKQGASQEITLSDSMRTQLELQRAQLPSAKAMAEFDASPAGQALLKAQRVISPAASAVPVLREMRR